MSVRQHTYEEKFGNDGTADSESISVLALRSSNRRKGDTIDKVICNPIDNKCIVVSGYSFSRA